MADGWGARASADISTLGTVVGNIPSMVPDVGVLMLLQMGGYWVGDMLRQQFASDDIAPDYAVMNTKGRLVEAFRNSVVMTAGYALLATPGKPNPGVTKK